MNFTTCYCPHPQCTHYGHHGFGAHLVHCGADRGIPRLLCTMGQGTVAVRQGTAYFGVRAEGSRTFWLRINIPDPSRAV